MLYTNLFVQYQVKVTVEPIIQKDLKMSIQLDYLQIPWRGEKS